MNQAKSLLYLQGPGEEPELAAAIRARGWQVHVTGRAEEARALLAGEPIHVGLLELPERGDAGLPEQTHALLGAESLNWVALLPDERPAPADLCRLISDYFFDYHTQPADLEGLLFTLGRAYGMARIAEACRSAQGAEQASAGVRLAMVGSSPPMQELVAQIQRVAGSDFNVLIRGESGTGKELAAQAVHRLSRRAREPFVAVNCGALPKELIQAELFGHEKGSFTGADRGRQGRIEAAQGGTLFLDEIGDLPLDLQVNLLRFLQEKTIQRIGGSTQIPVDVRVIAATHVNLEKGVAQGRFREDLYYRLNVLPLQVPALRHRPGDIELLAEHFFRQCSGRIRPQLKGFSQPALEAMRRHAWPGNVRELVNRVQRAVVMCDGRLIRPRDLALDQGVESVALMTLAQARAEAEKRVIEATLRAVRNNVSRAARQLDVSRVTLYRLMEQHAIDWQNSPEPASEGWGTA